MIIRIFFKISILLACISTGFSIQAGEISNTHALNHIIKKIKQHPVISRGIAVAGVGVLGWHLWDKYKAQKNIYNDISQILNNQERSPVDLPQEKTKYAILWNTNKPNNWDKKSNTVTCQINQYLHKRGI